MTGLNVGGQRQAEARGCNMRLQDYGTLQRMALQRMAQHRAWRQPSKADAVAMVRTMLGLWEGVGYPTVSHRIPWHVEGTTAVGVPWDTVPRELRLRRVG